MCSRKIFLLSKNTVFKKKNNNNINGGGCCNAYEEERLKVEKIPKLFLSSKIHQEAFQEY